MASIKENELPVSGSVTESDYVRIVTSGGASERASAANSIYKGLITLNTSASPGTVDGDLYAAIVALGWQNDVIE